MEAATDCHGGVVGESLFKFEDAEGSTNTYLKRTKHMVSKIIEGKMMTYAETTMAEYVQDSHPTKGNSRGQGRVAEPVSFGSPHTQRTPTGDARVANLPKSIEKLPTPDVHFSAFVFLHFVFTRYPGAKLVDLTGEGSKISMNYVLSDSSTGFDVGTGKAVHSTFYCDVDDNVTSTESAMPLPSGNNIPAVKKNDGKHALSYAGNHPFFGVDARKYWGHNKGQSPWEEGAEKFAIYEHAVEGRPYAIAVTPLFQKVWVTIGDADAAPAEFLARSKAHTGKSTVASFLAGPSDCGKYELAPTATLITDRRWQRSPPPPRCHISARP